ncbi:DUF932 domain-containing protein [Thiocapsa sp. N5-Cardenillas]|uniref:DUF932 domain-containing protein n=1 Tax=Thiocapsa sp. N5-Cardenillas TaxID=3137397 RepID=UPI0035B09177
MRSFARDYDLDSLKVIETEGNDLRLNAAGRDLAFTNWSFGQLASTIGAPAAYLRKLPAELAARNIRHGLEATRADSQKRDMNKLLMIRPTDGGPGWDLPATLQAVTSPTYGRIWDADVIALAQRIVADHPQFHNPKAYTAGGVARPQGLYASDHDVFCFLIDGGSQLEAGLDAYGNADTLHRGFFLSNSETGAATFSLATFYFRTICGNHIVWGAENVTRMTLRHSKGGPQRFESEALPELLSYVQSTARNEETAFKAAREYLLPADADKVLDLCARFKLTRPEVRDAIAVAKHEEGDCRNLWQLLAGFTASARDMQFADARLDLERRSSRLLDLVRGATPPESVTVPALPSSN